MIFFGIKSHRDNQGAVITFWKGCSDWILIALLASVFMHSHGSTRSGTLGRVLGQNDGRPPMKKWKQSGATDADIANQKAMMVSQRECSHFVSGWSLIEIFPVGLVVTLICAALRKQKFLAGHHKQQPRTNHANKAKNRYWIFERTSCRPPAVMMAMHQSPQTKPPEGFWRTHELWRRLAMWCRIRFISQRLSYYTWASIAVY